MSRPTAANLRTEARVLVVVTPYAQEAAVDEPGALLLGEPEPKAED